MLSYLKKILSYDPPEPFVLGESPDEQHEAPQESHIRAKSKRRSIRPLRYPKSWRICTHSSAVFLETGKTTT